VSKDKEFYSTFIALMGGLAVFAIILVIVAGNLTSEVSDYKPQEIVLENIKPVGQVYIAGESEPEVAAVAETASAEPRTGEAVYNGTCTSCHATGAAGSPKVGDAAAWAPRIATGIDALLANATSGLNAMPPKGLCMDCSEDELRGAIEYMVSQSQ